MNEGNQFFDSNKPKLKKIFLKHVSSREQCLSYADFQLICQTLSIVSPDMIGLGSLRSIVTRVLRSSAVSKASISLSQFEELLLQIINSCFSSNCSKREKTQAFFRHISSAAKDHYGINFITKESALPRQISLVSNRPVSRGSSAGRSDSNSDIDINIKEALETLKSKRHPSKSVLSFNKETARKEMPKSPSVTSVRSDCKKIIDQHLQLKEFIEIEQSLQKEACKVTVNLKDNKRKKGESQEIVRDKYRVKKHEPVKSEINTPKSTVKAKEQAPLTATRAKILKSIDLKKIVARNTDPTKNRTQKNRNKPKPKPKNNTTIVNEHRNFIYKSRDLTFSKAFVKSIIFNAWKSLHRGAVK